MGTRRKLAKHTIRAVRSHHHKPPTRVLSKRLSRGVRGCVSSNSGACPIRCGAPHSLPVHPRAMSIHCPNFLCADATFGGNEKVFQL
ncbi:hypothetical protein L484_022349 [Morus notabilis]|uniref:Uncharacterized protein n=1 Tax=Morus notabilis TaxID=981085 RepID=W9QJ69_9ROSA|nr:hypothetical protein L484_022349 [Morus notabilis]